MNSRRVIGSLPRGEKCGQGITSQSSSHSAMTNAALQRDDLGHDRSGSWSCDNAETGSLTGLDCSAARLREILEHILPISPATQTDAAQSIVSARGPARKAKVRARHPLTAAIIGLTPTIFSTRVKL